jgi:hypothetical protein
MPEPGVLIDIDHTAGAAAPPQTRFQVVAWAAIVAFLIVAASMVLHRVPRELADANLQSDTAWYLAMANHRWPANGAPMNIHRVPTPFRYRVVVPFLASLLPLAPVLSLAVVTYLSLAGAYLFTLLTCQRLGLSKLESSIGLAVACTFGSPLYCFRNPLLTDGFGVLAVAAMTFAYMLPSFRMFVAWGLIGMLGRETVALVLPLWIVRDVRRALLLLSIAAAVLVIERVVLWAYVPDGAALRWALWQFVLDRIHHPQRFLADLVVSWGWAFGFLALGFILRPQVTMPVMPAVVAALGCAVITSTLSTDAQRYFSVVLPAMAIAFAVVVREWIDERNWLMLALLACMAVLQFFVSWPNNLVDEATWKATLAVVPMAKIGAVWIVIVSLALRRPLRVAFAELPVARRPVR